MKLPMELSGIVKRLKVPTGDILIVRGKHGQLETLSLADYGQHVNLNQDAPVPDGTPLMPLSEKWVITMSTQYGCSMGCAFCDVPRVGRGKNATLADLGQQLAAGLSIHPEVQKCKRLNIHFARMGEPTWNPAVLDFARIVHGAKADGFEVVHPVVSTMMPKENKWLGAFLRDWMRIKNEVYGGDAGLQISINSTHVLEREHIFGGSAHSLTSIARIMSGLEPKGRKITLNFAVAGFAVDERVLANLFDPKLYVCKLTPMHDTATAVRNQLRTEGDASRPEPYRELRDRLMGVGYDVLVFIASREEDASRITCGNAILSGTAPEKYEEVPQLLVT